ncbi:MOP flippase family protein [Flavobacterium sp. SUN052]|uniref:MOP flippase family protein n=1 Tax=Flavobacterium sp. SUN052 TaxID=3002441 RepID=UPI00237E17D6|nr:MOP flippase family protein [Flavobacterium sp. SUN052]MEC4005487.1 MOP flippase family protein [Flavobacterium sp. SUN052]
MSLKSKVKHGLKWTFIDQVLSQIIFLTFSIFLARILTPSMFGIVGMVTIFSNFAIIFIDLGFSAALIQKKEVTQSHFSSVFWLNLAIGFLMYLLFFISSPFISKFYNQPELILLIRIICLSFIITSLSSVQANILIKELQFKKKVIINWIAMLVGYLVAFIMAYKDYGVWSLVIMTLTTSILNTIFYWIASKWVPLFIFEWKKIKELSNYGLNFLGDTSVNYWSRNYDNFIIAKMLGSNDLGIYSRAYSLMLLPLRNISTIVTKVMFPAFSQKQDNIELLKKYYLNIIKYIALITFPLMIGLSLVSKEFVLLFFGDKWSKMIPILSILSGLGAIQSIISLNGLIYNSLGKVNIAFKVSILSNIVLIIGFSIGVNYGIIGVSYSYLISSALLFVPIYKMAIKQLSVSLLEVFLVLKSILFATLVMAIALLLFNIFFELSLLISLIVKVLIGFIFYISVLILFEKELFLNLKSKLNS